MELLLQFELNPYRIYQVSKRTNKNIATFPLKNASSYLDYSVDFSRRFQGNEYITRGSVTVNGVGLVVSSVSCNASYLTAFIEGGTASHTYFLTYEAQTNLGGFYIQEMILSITGQQTEIKQDYLYLTFTEKVKPPNTRPPLNALKINNCYLVSDSSFFMGI
ncbi:unnamed protein product [Commensalibacter communis]|uniref:Uncharacterized protein n=1 Tax=Commensalibacter communis TaxID=2972786 RepID=A0A9W4XIW6_9PROT|nr:hypothetical protein [Commensalibacter communis]CAI3941400.1 unnamed protein product [Commensalibacter communis]CAI3945232.1 unnamed protein product [Commensalibacter communis]CAI3959371.1 unnamed protein product [Commensalibacter communis]CAI3960720.1 unnamed protein product [Commensalibacter communis]